MTENEPEEIVEPDETPEELEDTQDFQVNYLEEFRKTGLRDLQYLEAAIDGGRKDLIPHLTAVEEAMALIPDDKRSPRLTEFKDRYEQDRYLDTKLLKEALAKGDLHDAAVPVRNALWRALKSVPSV